MARPKISTIILSSLLAATSVFSVSSSKKLDETQYKLNQANNTIAQYEERIDELTSLEHEYRVLEEKYNRISDQYDAAQERCRYYENEIIDLKEELEDSQSQTVVTNLIENNTQSKPAPNRSTPQLNSKPAQSSSSSSGPSRTIPYKENYHGHVYRTKTGKCYHYESPCGRGNYFECTWEDVDRLGLDACGKCVLH